MHLPRLARFITYSQNIQSPDFVRVCQNLGIVNDREKVDELFNAIQVYTTHQKTTLQKHPFAFSITQVMDLVKDGHTFDEILRRLAS